MKRFVVVLVVAGLVAPAAVAKGPSQATITGPGLGKALITGNGESAGTTLGYLAQYTGFFPGAFGQSPDPMLHGRPAGLLGPSYTAHYVVPDGEGTKFRIVQQLYPYAPGGPVTYMEPGQLIFGERTRGGWYRGEPALKALLVRQGLPRIAPRVAEVPRSRTSAAEMVGVGAPLAILLAGAAAFVAGRRIARSR
jgi:hypothetical protein